MFFQEEDHNDYPATETTDTQQNDVPEQPATEKNPEAYQVQNPIPNEEVPTETEQTTINKQNAEVNARLQQQTDTDPDNDKTK